MMNMASTCGDNCAKWLLKIAEQEERTVNLCHLMDFGKKPSGLSEGWREECDSGPDAEN